MTTPTHTRVLIAALAALAALSLPVVAHAAKPPHATSAKAQAGKVRALPDSAAVMALLAGVHNGACPLAGVATGGQPDSAHLAKLAHAGFTTVLDLRAADEARGFDEAAAMRAAGLAYITLPVTPATLDDRVFDTFRTTMGKRGGQGVFVHCASGNRVGAAMIPWLVLERGWDVERAVASARAGGLKSPELEAKARDYVSRKLAAR